MSDRSVRVTLTAKVEGFQAAMAKAKSSVDEIVASTSKAAQTDAWKSASSTLMLFGATAMGVATAASMKFASFEEKMSQVAATGENARQNLDALRDSAMHWGAETKYSADEAAEGIESLLKAGVDASDVIGGGLQGALTLAATGNLSVADSADAAAIAMQQFGLAGKDIPHIADLLAAGAGKATGEVSDFAGALNQAGLVASQFGLSIEETVGGLAAFANAGLIGSEAGTSLRSMLSQLAAPSNEAAQLMKDLGISAYDASGEFVGLENLAGQLKSQLADLTPQQRDFAMATIFGAYSVRAANVLYEEGAEGIAHWTAEVSEAGYAAESAAIRQDNLRGDIEKLGGAIDTLAIAGGEAAAGGLRTLVQGLTSIIDSANEYPEVASNIVATVGVLGALALTAGGVMKAATAAVQMAEGLKAIKAAAVAASATEMGKLGIAAGIAGTSLLIMGMAGSRIQERLDAMRLSTDAAEQALVKFGETGAKTQLDDSFAQALAGTGESVRDLGSGLQMLSEYGGTAWESVESFIMGVVNMKGNITMLREETDKLDSALSHMSTEDAARSFSRLYGEVDQSKISLEEFTTLFPQYEASLRSTAEALGVVDISQREMSTWMSTGLEPAALRIARVLADQGVAHVAAGASADEQAEALQNLISIQNEAAAAAINASNAQIGYYGALDNATKLAEEQNGVLGRGVEGFDLYTEAGRAAQSSLDGVASAALKSRDSMLENGEAIETVTAFTAQAREEFIKAAVGLGLNEEAAHRLADQYGLIPGQIVSEISVNGAEISQEKVKGFLESLNMLPPEVKAAVISEFESAGYEAAMESLGQVSPETAAVIMSAWESGGYDAAVAALNSVDPEIAATIISQWDSAGYKAAMAALASVTDKTVTITTIHQVLEQRVAYNIGQPGRAGGGPVWGPGTATSDSILTKLSNGEFVVRTWAANRIGYDRLAFMNATGQIPRFANGGRVNASPPRMVSIPSSIESRGENLAPIRLTSQLVVDGKILAQSIRQYDRSLQ